MNVKPLDLLINAPAKIAQGYNYLTVKKFAVSNWNCSVVYNFSSNRVDMPGQLRWESITA